MCLDHRVSARVSQLVSVHSSQRCLKPFAIRSIASWLRFVGQIFLCPVRILAYCQTDRLSLATIRKVLAALAINSEFAQILENIARIVVQNGKFELCHSLHERGAKEVIVHSRALSYELQKVLPVVLNNVLLGNRVKKRSDYHQVCQ